MVSLDGTVDEVAALFRVLLLELSVAARRQHEAKVAGLVAQLREAVVNERACPTGGAKQYWQGYRERQQYAVEVRGEGVHEDKVITGRGELLKYLGWKESSLRTKLAQGRGRLSVRRGTNFLTITRIEK